MTSPVTPISESPKQQVQLTVHRRPEPTNRTQRNEPPIRRLETQIEKVEECWEVQVPRNRSDTDPTPRRLEPPRRSSDTPLGLTEPDGGPSSTIPSRRVRGDLSRRVNYRELGRNSLPGGTRISLPVTRKLTMMERMSRRRVLSDGDFTRDYWSLQVGYYLTSHSRVLLFSETGYYTRSFICEVCWACYVH